MTEQKPIGVIEALYTGFDIVRRRPWTLALPILFDAILWIAPRLSLTPLVQPLIAQVILPLQASADSVDMVKELQTELANFASSLNLFGLVSAALNQIINFPSLLGFSFLRIILRLDTPLPSSPINSLAFSINIDSSLLTAILFIPLFLLGLFAGALFLNSVAQGLRPLEQQTATQQFIQVGLLWLRLISFTAVLFAIFIFGSPLAFIIVQASLINPDLGAFLSALVLVALFWLFIYLYFVTSILAVSRVGVLEAARRSVLIFRLGFLQAFLLILIVFVINQGWSLVWRGFEVSSLGVALSIIANAFIGTALLAAGMVYYQDRFNWFLRIRERLAHQRG